MENPLGTSGNILEMCIDDIAGAISAARAGADRVEYCLNITEGGTTPDLESTRELLEALKEYPHVGIQILIRERLGNFTYNHEEIDRMCQSIEDIKNLEKPGTNQIGYVVGAITEDRQLDLPATKRFREVAADATLTFHRAFDELSDGLDGIKKLIELGYNRILTTGKGIEKQLETNTVNGLRAETGYSVSGLAELVKAGGRNLTILASGGIRPDTWDPTLTRIGLKEFHLRAPWEDGDTRDPDSGNLNPATVRVMRKILDA
ncbi:hypothetical protein KRX54_01775 [Actinomycetaceae bacterium TAE3-ERU4]|nr:hypothetical protein [Actinomycetaceae bacterium TAE3-ERU4]